MVRREGAEKVSFDEGLFRLFVVAALLIIMEQNSGRKR